MIDAVMRRWLFFAVIAVLVLGTSLARAQEQYTLDQDISAQLTHDLHTHRLPGVGAQVLEADDGTRQVILYGFVATNQGMADAEQRTRRFLGKSDLMLEDRIVVNPSVRNTLPAPSGDIGYPPPPPPMGSPATSIFDSPPTAAMRYPTPLPTIVPNLFAP
jgi:hypothetical protein